MSPTADRRPPTADPTTPQHQLHAPVSHPPLLKRFRDSQVICMTNLTSSSKEPDFICLTATVSPSSAFP
ncbi:MAG: hypothetical protein ACJAXZ_001053 [Akkermansiaceae bacterium]|jgi:hypothetical protein